MYSLKNIKISWCFSVSNSTFFFPRYTLAYEILLLHISRDTEPCQKVNSDWRFATVFRCHLQSLRSISSLIRQRKPWRWRQQAAPIPQYLLAINKVTLLWQSQSSTVETSFKSPHKYCVLRVTQPLGCLGRNQSPVRRVIRLWHAAT